MDGIKDKQPVETEDTEILESQPDTNGEENKAIEKTGISDTYLAHLDFVAKNIDRFVIAKQKIWQAILRLAKEGDWVVFESEDKNSPTGKRSSVCLSGAGADRVASSIGISFTNWKEKREEGEDEKGKWYRYWFEVDTSFGGRTIKVMGRSSSRDKFFGMAYGQLKELSDIDESNIRMAAFHNAMKEGVKILLGLRNIPLEEFEKAGIKMVYARKYEFKSKPQAAKPPNGQSANHSEPEELYCQCGSPITQAEAAFSQKNYGKQLCRTCQAPYKRR